MKLIEKGQRPQIIVRIGNEWVYDPLHRLKKKKKKFHSQYTATQYTASQSLTAVSCLCVSFGQNKDPHSQNAPNPEFQYVRRCVDTPINPNTKLLPNRRIEECRSLSLRFPIGPPNPTPRLLLAKYNACRRGEPKRVCVPTDFTLSNPR